MLDTESRQGNAEVMMGYMYNQQMLSTSDEHDKADNSSDNLHQSDKSPASSPGKYPTRFQYIYIFIFSFTFYHYYIYLVFLKLS